MSFAVSWGNVPLFGTLADQSSMMAAGGGGAGVGNGLPVDGGIMPPQHTAAAAAAVGIHVGYPATVNDVNAMMMMSDMYHGNPSTVDQSAIKHMLLSVTHCH